MISVIIPVYNEGNVIIKCLDSLSEQTASDIEIIVIDDGSTDNLRERIRRFIIERGNINYIPQKHKGPATARNHGASFARGDILVFADADMTYKKDFIEKLINPIELRKCKGTFTKEEYVSNWDNVWARCWNYNQGLPDKRKIPVDYPDTSPVFRAILKSEFLKVKGFDNIGFTDDWTLSRKLKYQAMVAREAICFHENPTDLKEVYKQARWIGKNEFISGTILRKITSLLRFSVLIQFFRSLLIAARFRELGYIIFSFVYYSAVTVSIIFSFFGEEKIK